ncbi:RcpC/CpaB family pilus assembly protein [Streptomyces sp. NPDC090025]|uniref:RcpC/CpaB family pilus assembly protein n=1 Tax=Streptomyces sp. NPDC090025 TaxID=3365922 RepID=UPI0038336B5F
MTAAALAATGVAGADDLSPQPPPPVSDRPAHRPSPVPLVSAPVRISDAATVRLLRPGDRVDVIAAPNSALGEAGEAHVVASGVRVAEVPRSGETRSDGGALVVLSVPRSTATALAGAGMTSQLAVTLC